MRAWRRETEWSFTQIWHSGSRPRTTVPSARVWHEPMPGLTGGGVIGPRASPDDAVPPLVLGLVQPRVRRLDQLHRGHPFLAVGGRDAGADRHLEGPRAAVEGVGLDRRPQLLGLVDGPF